MESEIITHTYPNSMTAPIFLLLVSLAHAYFIVPHIPKGLLRLIFIIPNLYILLLIPWYPSSSFLRGVLSFFLTWITSFKLLLFCFDLGFLISCKSYIEFVLVAVFPIKNSQNSGSLELMQLVDRPYLANSLQDFWGRRWNRLSSYILRHTIYIPTLNSFKGVVGIRAEKMVALLVTLVVSGVMHELMFYYITCGKRPTWECGLFFVLHGVCMVFEVLLRLFWKAMGWKPIHPIFPVFLTLGFVVSTSLWLLVLPVWRSGQNKCSSMPKAFGSHVFF